MADIFKEIARLPQVVEAKLGALSQSVQGGIDTTTEILATMYGVFRVIGDFFAWMGLHAMLLLLATMIALYLIGIISPLERRINYLLAVIIGSVLAYISEFPMVAYGKYLLVMGAPVVVTYLPMLIWMGIRKRWQQRRRSEPEEKEKIVGELMESASRYHKEGDAVRLRAELELLTRRLE